MWLKTVAAAAAFAGCVALGVPGYAGADPAEPTDPATPVSPVEPVTPAAPNTPVVAEPPAAAVTPPVPETPPTDSATPAATVTPTDPAAPPAPKTSIDADGTYAVGTDIAPGVYSSAGPVGDGTCYWKRTGADGAILDNALTKKPQTVQVAPTDQSFKTNGCQAWQLSDAAAPVSQGMSPAMAGVQLKLYMAQLQARAGASGQAPTP
jgi:type IV secretory pathway VirB10-like protein